MNVPDDLDEKALQELKEDRETANDSFFTRHKEDEPEPDPAPEPPVDEAAAAPPVPPEAAPPKPPAAAARPKPKRAAKAAPQTAEVAMPPAKHTPEPSVQFGPRIRSDLADRLNAFCADFDATKQDTVDMALAEWLARRGYPASPDIVVPPLSVPVDLTAPEPAAGGVPMPPRRSAIKRRQLNVRIRPETNQALIQFTTDHSSVIQDIADMALAEFLAIREQALQPANT
ncbi:hypothetical protein [Glycomyces sp. MUSA5-2]|uniref:hypothetical protein n=1 Tax=Glycomyces sp. MUSA5-2 TaxID=2053002 RepID=UPI003008F786